MGRGRDAEAVAVVHCVAAYNGYTSTLTLDMMRALGDSDSSGEPDTRNTSAKAAVVRKLGQFSSGHVGPLFATRKLAYSTSLLIVLWGGVQPLPYVAFLLIVLFSALIGLAFPL